MSSGFHIRRCWILKQINQVFHSFVEILNFQLKMKTLQSTLRSVAQAGPLVLHDCVMIC